MRSGKIIEPMKISLVLFAALIFFKSVFVLADDKLTGQEIAQRRFDINRGWANLSADVRMELKQGSTTAVRQMHIKMLELENTGESDLLRVLQPADLSGTILLTTVHDSGPDEQWLYLPALKRVKRIAMEGKGGAFLSSQFSFENMSPFQVSKYTYKRLADETYAGESCYVLESTPIENSSVYGRLINWITRDDYRLLKTEFFDKDNSLEKTLYIEKYAKYRDKYWKPVQLKMVSNKSDAITVAIWSNFAFGERIDAHEFDAANLKRIGF